MIFIVLPTYNEQEVIRPLLEGIDQTLKEYRHDYRIILVDDGSTDGTVKRIESLRGTLPMEILTHEKNRGLGEALKTGLFHAVKGAAGQDVIVTMDADSTHLPGLIMRLNRNVWEGSDLVIASRYVKNARLVGVPWHRRVLGYAACLLFRVFCPIPGVRDYTCGYRAYQAAMLQKAFAAYGDEFVSEPGFSCQIDILLKLNRFRPIITEVPILLRYDRHGGASKMKIGPTIRDTLKLLVRQLFRRP